MHCYWKCSISCTIHVHVYIVPTMLTELLCPLKVGYTPLHLAARGGCITCVERLLSTAGIDVNIKGKVSWSTEYLKKLDIHCYRKCSCGCHRLSTAPFESNDKHTALECNRVL